MWNNFSKENIIKIEKSKKEQPKWSLSYEDTLKKLGLTTLEVRRKRCDLIQIYKIKNGIEGIFPLIFPLIIPLFILLIIRLIFLLIIPRIFPQIISLIILPIILLIISLIFLLVIPLFNPLIFPQFFH